MNVLLIYPPFPDTFWSLKHAIRFLRKRSAFPPLGLLTVGALLPRHWDVRLVDLNVAALSDADLAWADLAFVSAMAVQREPARQIVARCRRAGVRVVAGGPLFSTEPADFPEVDHLVLNEAELTLPPFLEDLEQGREPKRVYRSDEHADLRRTPAPRWDLIDPGRYASMSVQFSRGCPYNCDFCNVTALFGRRPRTKSAGQILEELEGLRRLGWRGPVFFVDDNLIGNRKALKTDLLPALIRWRRQGARGMPFNTQVSINIADDEEMMRLMVQAGFDTVFVGIETPDSDSLIECNKVQNRNRELVADVRRIHRAGMQVQGGFIVGFDSDEPSIFQRQIEFIQASGIVTAMVGLLQAIPGTALYERLRREGRLLSSSSGDNVDGSTNIRPLMDAAVLRDGYRSILRTIYAPGRYYERIRTFLRDYRPQPIAGQIDRQRVVAFLRSLLRLGVLGRERVQFWYLLLWTLVRRPRAFTQAVTLAICGHHFRRICELHVLNGRGARAV